MDAKMSPVKLGPYGVWMLHDDFQFERFSQGQGNVPEPWPFDLIFEHHCALDLRVEVLDVGAKYGVGAMILADMVRRRGRGGREFAFEPGPSKVALARTIAANGFADLIHLDERAVSDVSGAAMLYCDPAHPEDNHIVDRGQAVGYEPLACATVSLDDFTSAESLVPPLIAKIDTQGAEWEVWNGTQRLIAAGPVTFIMEFTPWTFDSRVKPEFFLEALLAHHFVCDVSPKNMTGASRQASQPPSPIELCDIEEVTDRVRRSALQWTDLLAIPITLPGAQALLVACLRGPPN